MSKWTSCGYSFDSSPSKFGELRSSNEILSNRCKLQTRMQEDGYLLLRQILNPDLVENCRIELAKKLDSIGDIDRRYPLIDTIQNPESQNAQMSAT